MNDTNLDHILSPAAVWRVAEDQRSESRLTRQLGLMELAERYAGLGHWHVDLTSLEVTWSPVVFEIYGVEPGSFEPDFSSAVDFLHPEDRPRLLEAWARALNERTGYEIEARLIRPNGELVHVIAKAKVQLDRDGDPIGVFGIFQDVTEREREVRRRANADRLTALGTLAAGLAHEINNPMAFLTANLEYAAEVLRAVRDGQATSADVSEALEALTEASAGAARVDSIVSSLRTFGALPTSGPAEFDLILVIQDVLSERARPEHIRYESTLLEANAPVAGDGAVVGKVIEELLDNAERAVRSIQGRAPVVGVHLTRCEENFIIEVVDNGHGMDDEVIKKAFEPFFSTYDVDEGNGLGLSSCLGIINSLGGSIELASRPGLGTTVTLTLPVAVADESDDDDSSANQAELAAQTLIYVVEDEALVARAIRRTLGNSYRVEFFDGADSALEALEEDGEPAAIICDIMMPGKTGLDLYRLVEKRYPGFIDSFIFLSGGVFSESMENRISEIKAPRVAKPFSSDHLRETVKQVVDRI